MIEDDGSGDKASCRCWQQRCLTRSAAARSRGAYADLERNTHVKWFGPDAIIQQRRPRQGGKVLVAGVDWHFPSLARDAHSSGGVLDVKPTIGAQQLASG